MIAGHERDAAATVVVCAFFASAWFGWAQDTPPKSWRLPLAASAVGSVVLAAVGAVLTWQRWSEGTAFDRATSQTFGLVVAVEVVLGAAGAVLLGRTGHGDLTPAWIALVVGVHFVPLAPLLGYPLYYPLAAGLVAVSAAAVPAARSLRVPPSAVTGAGAGAVLLAAALFSLATVLA